jgi:hypothetical protein
MKAMIDLKTVRIGLETARFFVDVVSTKPYNTAWFEQQKRAKADIQKAFGALDNPVIAEESE